MTQLPHSAPRGPNEKLTIAEVCARTQDLPVDVLRLAGQASRPTLHHPPQRQPAHPPRRPRPLAQRPRGRRLMDTTYDVRVYKTEVYRGTRVSSHTRPLEDRPAGLAKDRSATPPRPTSSAPSCSPPPARARRSTWPPASQCPGSATSLA